MDIEIGVGEIRLDQFAEDCLKEIRRLKVEIARQSAINEEMKGWIMMYIEIDLDRANKLHSHASQLKKGLLELFEEADRQSDEQPTTSKTEKVEPCDKCSDEYHQDFEVWFTRYHTSEHHSTKKIAVNYCPNCGRRLED